MAPSKHKKTQSAAPPFDLLPAELRGHIFDKSDLRGYDVRARVCTAWRRDVHDYLRELEVTVGVPLPALRLRNEVDLYGIPYATTVQKDAILDVIRKHNTSTCTKEFIRRSEYEDYRPLEAGTELFAVRALTLKRPVHGTPFHNVILCCNTRASWPCDTHIFLDWELGRALNDPAIEVRMLRGYDRITQQLLQKEFSHVQWVDQELVKGEKCDADAPEVYCTRHNIYIIAESDVLAKYEYQRESEPGEILSDGELDY